MHAGDQQVVSLEEGELAFLEQLLWFTTNIIGDNEYSHVDAFKHSIDKLLGIVLHNYNHQFTEGIWKIMTWCLSVLSLGLQYLKEPEYEVFNCFICLHYQTVSKLIFDDPKVDEADKLVVKGDMLAMVHNMIKDAPDS